MTKELGKATMRMIYKIGHNKSFDQTPFKGSSFNLAFLIKKKLCVFMLKILMMFTFIILINHIHKYIILNE